jgi:hypothetical protein
LAKPFPAIMDYMPTGTPCIMMRREAIDAVGDFDVDLQIGEDWDLWYRIAKKFDFAYTLEGLTCVRDHPQNMEKGDSGAIAAKVKLILKHLPDVREPAARAEQVRRLGGELELLQEQLLREKRRANGWLPLLEHELAPRTLRFKVGSIVRRQPEWIGSAYARLVRTLGQLHRGERKQKKEEAAATRTEQQLKMKN